MGGPGRVLEASPKGVFDRVVPRGSQRAIWDHFGFIFDRFPGSFWRPQAKFSMDFVNFFRAAVNDKLKQGTDRTQDVN